MMIVGGQKGNYFWSIIPPNYPFQDFAMTLLGCGHEVKEATNSPPPDIIYIHYAQPHAFESSCVSTQ